MQKQSGCLFSSLVHNNKTTGTEQTWNFVQRVPLLMRPRTAQRTTSLKNRCTVFRQILFISGFSFRLKMIRKMMCIEHMMTSSDDVSSKSLRRNQTINYGQYLGFFLAISLYITPLGRKKRTTKRVNFC